MKRTEENKNPAIVFKKQNLQARDRVTRKKNWRDISSLQEKMVKGEIGD